MTSDIYSFTISGDVNGLTDLTDVNRVKYNDADCKNDYVYIPGGSLTGLNQDRQFAYDRFCGSTLGVCGTRTGTNNNPCSTQIGPVTSKSPKTV